MSYFDTIAAARYAGYCQPDGTVTAVDRKRFYAFADRHLKKYRAGRVLRFKSDEIDLAMEGGDPIVEHALRLAASGGKR